MDVKGKKLLVLGGTSTSCEIIKAAKELGVHVIVTDYLDDSPGKKIADDSFNISTKNVDAIVELIKTEKIDGVITGFIEWMLPYYYEICEKAKLPCYFTKKQLEITSNKDQFKNLCREFGINVVEEYKTDSPNPHDVIERIELPVVIKPVDSGGGRGVRISHTQGEFINDYNKSLQFSNSNKVILERYMDNKEATIFYIIIDGQIHLTAIADRNTARYKEGYMPLPTSYIFPSKHTDYYIKNLNENVIKMFNSIDLKNGMLFIQTFVEEGQFTIYEMGYRLTPSMEYKIIEKNKGYNPLKMMINFALTGKMIDNKLENITYTSNDDYGANITISVKPGKIFSIQGVEKVQNIPGVIDVFQTYKEGDIIDISAEGTLRQIAIRIFLVAKTKCELELIMKQAYDLIKIKSDSGEDMVI